MFRRAVYLSLPLWFATGFFPGCATAQEQPPAAGYTFQECDTLEQSALRDELNRLAQQSMNEAAIDLAEIVERHWLELNIDAVIDGTLDEATGAIAVAGKAGADSYDIVDEIAGLTLRSGGRAIGLRKADLPVSTSPLAAIYRYPA